jgi:hypothetical protein
MIDKLKEEFKNYKDITLKLVKVLEEEKYDELNDLLSERQELIDKVNSINYKRADIASVFSELKLLEAEDKLKDLMKKKMDGVKDNIDNLAKTKRAGKSYNSKFSVDPIYFNKKI